MAGLLDELTPDQQLLVDLTADGYFDPSGRWPIFDFLEAEFDRQHKDAWDTLYSLPRFGRWNYGLTWWTGINQPWVKPPAEVEIELTVLGMHHAASLKSWVPIFLNTLQLMVDLRRNTPASPEEPRRLELSSKDLNSMLTSLNKVPLNDTTLDRLPMLWRREPATWGEGESRDAEGAWAKGIPRSVLEYEGVTTMQEYIDRLEALTAIPVQAAVEVTPSPLELVAALDFLNMTWRVLHSGPLFGFPSAEGTAKLSYPANTADELDSRLSTLGEILRTANKSVRATAQAKLAKQTHEEPLAPLRDFLSQQPGLNPGRVASAVDALEAALSVRDATQHTEAGGRAVKALAALEVPHPVADAADAWAKISARVVGAVNAIREEMIASL